MRFSINFDILNTSITETSWDVSGNGTIMIFQIGNFRIINITGFQIAIAGITTYSIGPGNASAKGAYIPVIVSGTGAGFLYINSAGYIGVYSADMTRYLTGTIYGTGIYHI